MLVLDVISGREIHDIGALGLHQLNAGGEHEFRQIGAVDRRQRPVDEAQRIVDAVLDLGRLVGLLGREADAAHHALAEELPELVLGGDDGNLGAGLGECRQNGLGAQEFGIVHHHLLPALAVIEVIATDAMHRRRRAGDDGEVVGVGEARHHAIADQIGAVGDGVLQPGHDAGLDRFLKIIGLAAIDTDDDDGILRGGIVLAVNGNRFHHFLLIQPLCAQAHRWPHSFPSAPWRPRRGRPSFQSRQDGRCSRCGTNPRR